MSSGLQLSAPNSLSSLISFLIILQLAFIVTPGKAHASSLSQEEIDYIFIQGITQNGDTAAGLAYVDGEYKAALRANGKTTILSDQKDCVVNGVSANGSVVVGTTDAPWDNARAVRWVDGKMSYLKGPDGITQSKALSVSSDGSVIVGSYMTLPGHYQAFRWTQNQGMIGLGSLGSGTPVSFGAAVSADGSTVVGSTHSPNGTEAFRWKEGTMTGLGVLHLPSTRGGVSIAKAVSENGSVVVGSSNNQHGQREAFRWVNGTMTGLGFLENHHTSYARGVSGDGNAVVGYSHNADSHKGFYWTPILGMISIDELMISKGVDLKGQSINNAKGISSDGSLIYGHHYIFNIVHGGFITLEGLYQSLDDMESVSPIVNNMGQLSMSRLTSVASGHAPRSQVRSSENSKGMSSGNAMPGRLDLWMVGSLGANLELNGDDINLSGGMGLSWETDNWRFGGGLFADSRDLETGYNGSQDISALGPGAFVTYSPEGTRFEFRVSSLWQSVDLDLTRGYMNGAGYATSSGSTEAEVFSLSGQVQWTGNISETLSLTPFIEYTWQTTHVDAYTESGGPFPANFDSRDENSNLIRTGLRADVALIDKLDTWVWGAWNHRLEDTSTGMSGSATGIGAFAYPGAPIDQDWADVGVGTSWSITDRLSATTSLGFAIGCDDNSVSDTTLSAGLSYQLW